MQEDPRIRLLEEEEQAFFAAIGKAITQWQEVEEGLSLIFTGVMGYPAPGHHMVANAAFHTVLNFETKLGMTDSALEMAYFGSPLSGTVQISQALTEWRTLHNRCGRRAKRRNELAHFMRMFDPNRKPGRRYFLRPNIIDSRAWMRSEGTPIERETRLIVATGDSFEILGIDLKAFFVRWLYKS